MEIRKYGNKKILIADEGKHIRNINDIDDTPYYASIIFLADNFDESKLNELYVEEEIGEVE